MARDRFGPITLWKTIRQWALAILLIVGGLSVFIDGKSDALVSAVGKIFSNGNVRDVIVYIMAAIEIITGIFLILDMLHLKSKLIDRLDDIFMAILIICYFICFIILGDFVPLFKGNLSFMAFLVDLAKNCVILCAFGIVKCQI